MWGYYMQFKYKSITVNDKNLVWDKGAEEGGGCLGLGTKGRRKEENKKEQVLKILLKPCEAKHLEQREDPKRTTNV